MEVAQNISEPMAPLNNLKSRELTIKIKNQYYEDKEGFWSAINYNIKSIDKKLNAIVKQSTTQLGQLQTQWNEESGQKNLLMEKIFSVNKKEILLNDKIKDLNDEIFLQDSITKKKYNKFYDSENIEAIESNNYIEVIEESLEILNEYFDDLATSETLVKDSTILENIEKINGVFIAMVNQLNVLKNWTIPSVIKKQDLFKYFQTVEGLTKFQQDYNYILNCLDNFFNGDNFLNVYDPQSDQKQLETIYWAQKEENKHNHDEEILQLTLSKGTIESEIKELAITMEKNNNQQLKIIESIENVEKKIKEMEIQDAERRKIKEKNKAIKKEERSFEDFNDSDNQSNNSNLSIFYGDITEISKIKETLLGDLERLENIITITNKEIENKKDKVLSMEKEINDKNITYAKIDEEKSLAKDGIIKDIETLLQQQSLWYGEINNQQRIIEEFLEKSEEVFKENWAVQRKKLTETQKEIFISESEKRTFENQLDSLTQSIGKITNGLEDLEKKIDEAQDKVDIINDVKKSIGQLVEKKILNHEDKIELNNILNGLNGEFPDFLLTMPLINGENLEKYLNIIVDGKEYEIGELANQYDFKVDDLKKKLLDMINDGAQISYKDLKIVIPIEKKIINKIINKMVTESPLSNKSVNQVKEKLNEYFNVISSEESEKSSNGNQDMDSNGKGKENLIKNSVVIETKFYGEYDENHYENQLVYYSNPPGEGQYYQRSEYSENHGNFPDSVSSKRRYGERYSDDQRQSNDQESSGSYRTNELANKSSGQSYRQEEVAAVNKFSNQSDIKKETVRSKLDFFNRLDDSNSKEPIELENSQLIFADQNQNLLDESTKSSVNNHHSLDETINRREEISISYKKEQSKTVEIKILSHLEIDTMYKKKKNHQLKQIKYQGPGHIDQDSNESLGSSSSAIVLDQDDGIDGDSNNGSIVHEQPIDDKKSHHWTNHKNLSMEENIVDLVMDDQLSNNEVLAKPPEPYVEIIEGVVDTIKSLSEKDDENISKTGGYPLMVDGVHGPITEDSDGNKMEIFEHKNFVDVKLETNLDPAPLDVHMEPTIPEREDQKDLPPIVHMVQSLEGEKENPSADDHKVLEVLNFEKLKNRSKSFKINRNSSKNLMDTLKEKQEEMPMELLEKMPMESPKKMPMESEKSMAVPFETIPFTPEVAKVVIPFTPEVANPLAVEVPTPVAVGMPLEAPTPSSDSNETPTTITFEAPEVTFKSDEKSEKSTTLPPIIDENLDPEESLSTITKKEDEEGEATPIAVEMPVEQPTPVTPLESRPVSVKEINEVNIEIPIPASHPDETTIPVKIPPLLKVLPPIKKMHSKTKFNSFGKKPRAVPKQFKTPIQQPTIGLPRETITFADSPLDKPMIIFSNIKSNPNPLSINYSTVTIDPGTPSTTTNQPDYKTTIKNNQYGNEIEITAYFNFNDDNNILMIRWFRWLKSLKRQLLGPSSPIKKCLFLLKKKLINGPRLEPLTYEKISCNTDVSGENVEQIPDNNNTTVDKKSK
jgi:hypothetical protein